MQEWGVFIKEVKKKKIDSNISTTELAKLTGLKVNTIYKFMSNVNGRDKSDNVATKIAKALNIEL